MLFRSEEIGAHYEIIVDRKDYLDVMEIKVELCDDTLLDSYARLGELEKKIKFNLRTVLGLDAMIKLVAPRSLKRFEGKARRVTDLR